MGFKVKLQARLTPSLCSLLCIFFFMLFCVLYAILCLCIFTTKDTEKLGTISLWALSRAGFKRERDGETFISSSYSLYCLIITNNII